MKREKKYKHICKHCNKEYLGADTKGNCCYVCKEKIICKWCKLPQAKGWSLYRDKNPGACFKCYQKLNKGKTRKETIHKDYICPTKGKTYKEIYGTDTPQCGYQKGDKNIAKNVEIRKKLSTAVKKSYTPELRRVRSEQTKQNFLNGMHFGVLKQKDSYGNKYRSKLEANLSDILIEHNIKFNFEGKTNRIKLFDGSVKVVDFIVDNLLIEVTGFAYKKWQDDFIEKIIKLRKTTDKKILILTYDDKVKIIRHRLKKYKNIFIDCVDKPEKYITIIKKEK